jgi:hypothetical protein
MKKEIIIAVMIFNFQIYSYSQSDYSKYARNNQSQDQASKQDNNQDSKQEQNQTKADAKSFTAFDNTTFKTGDSIFIGLPTSYYFNKIYNNFLYIKEYKVGQYKNGYDNSSLNIALKKYQIIDMFDDNSENPIFPFTKGVVVIEVGKKGFFGSKYFIDITNAIHCGEVILNYKPANEPIAENFTDSLAILFKVKTSKQPAKNYAEEFLYRMHYNKHESVVNDEFEFNNAINQSTNELEDLLTNISSNKQFVIRTKLSVDNYDFNTLSFPMGGFEELYVLVYGISKGKGMDYNKSEFSTTNLVFINKDDMKLLPVEQSIANSFVKRRKDNSGNIDRRIYTKIYFNIVELPQDSPALSNYKNTASEYYLFAKINRIEVYDFEHCLYNFLGAIDSK